MSFAKLFAAAFLFFAGVSAFTLPKNSFGRVVVRNQASKLNAVKVMCGEDEPIENILRRFKRAVNQSGHLFELRFKEEWENSHDKRKRKAERARQLNKIERTNDRYERRADGGNEYNS